LAAGQIEVLTPVQRGGNARGGRPDARDYPLSRISQLLRAIGLAAAGAVLAWLVVSKSLVAFLAANAPQAALWLSPADPQALLNLAEGRLDPASEASPVAASALVREAAEAALAGDPIDARALRLLGQSAHAAGDAERARTFMEAAARRSVQDSWAAHWLLKDAYDRKEYAAALQYADTLLRTRTQALTHVLPVLARMAETPEAVAALEKVLAANPPWRRRFFSALPGAVTDARTPLRLLLAVRLTPDAPTLADIRGYVRLLMQHKHYDLAYYAWLQFLPVSQLAGAGLLFNGSFETVPSGLPFDWTMGGGKGATAEIAERPDRPGERALLVALGPGRVEFSGAEQTLMLPPGAYRLQASHRGELVGPRGLVWRIACVDAGGPPLGQSPMILSATPAWKVVEMAFTVPDKGCRVQQLGLSLDARMPSEQLVSGTVWFDDVRISRPE
jgi:tetratricopeptide (TPR) repeat protein